MSSEFGKVLTIDNNVCIIDIHGKYNCNSYDLADNKQLTKSTD